MARRSWSAGIVIFIALLSMSLSTPANAIPGPLPGQQRGWASLASVSPAASSLVASTRIRTLWGPLGRYITSADAVKPWGPRGRRAYRVDVPLMLSSNPIRYRTTFEVPGNPDLAGMRAAGIKLVLTVRNAPDNVDLPLPADRSADAAFKTALRAMIDQLHPDYLVYGNEVNSADKYTGTAAQFEHLMRIGHRVAASKGVRDGGTGLVGTLLAEATYANLRATQGRRAAAAFQRRSQMGPFHGSLASKANAYIDACREAGLDYFVWHSYFSDPFAILSIKRYVEERFGGPSFINELGWRTGKASTGKAIVDALDHSGIAIALVYGSGQGPNGPDMLWDTSGAQTSEGRVVSAHVRSR